MSFVAARSALVQALAGGRYAHVPRVDLEQKNWLATRRVDIAEVIALLHAARPAHYRASPHHEVPRLFVHEFVVDAQVAGHGRWYLKFFYHPDNPGQGWKVLSVHPSE